MYELIRLLLSFIDAYVAQGHKTLGSKTKDLIYSCTASSMSVSIFPLVLLEAKPHWGKALGPNE